MPLFGAKPAAILEVALAMPDRWRRNRRTIDRQDTSGDATRPRLAFVRCDPAAGGS